MASLGQLSLTGKSKKTYLFDIYILNTTFVAKGGLYLFTRKDTDGHHLIYLGHTKDLSSRFTDHHKQDCIDGKKGSHVSVCWIEDEKTRIAAETDLLGGYNFSCNEVNN